MIGFSPDPECAALHAAVLAAPADDAPRLALADRLLELGLPAGEFVAWQLRNPRLRLTRVNARLDGEGDWTEALDRDAALAATAAAYALQARAEYAAPVSDTEWERRPYGTGWMPLSALTWWAWTWERGFPVRVRLPVEDGLEDVLGLLLASWPVREVVTVGALWGWRGEYLGRGVDVRNLSDLMDRFRRRSGVAWFREDQTVPPASAAMTRTERQRVRVEAERLRLRTMGRTVGEYQRWAGAAAP